MKRPVIIIKNQKIRTVIGALILFVGLILTVLIFYQVGLLMHSHGCSTHLSPIVAGFVGIILLGLAACAVMLLVAAAHEVIIYCRGIGNYFFGERG